MANENKKPELKKPKFNQNWIFGAIILVFLGIMLSGGGSWSQPKKITQTEFETYMRNGEVERIEGEKGCGACHIAGRRRDYTSRNPANG